VHHTTPHHTTPHYLTGGQDTVGGSTGDEIVPGALKDLEETTAGDGDGGGISWASPAAAASEGGGIDVFDAVNEWWTPAASVPPLPSPPLHPCAFISFHSRGKPRHYVVRYS